MAALAVLCSLVAAPGPAAAPLPEAAVRAFDSIDADSLRRYVGTLASDEFRSLGAEAFVASPQPGRRVVAYLNLDMVGRREEIPNSDDWRFRGLPRTEASATGNTLHVLGYSYTPELAATLRSANEGVGLTLQEDYDQGAQGLLQRSDNWPFLVSGIPALFLTTGLHPDYHTPDDDTARIDFAKLTRITRLAARAAWMAADGPEPKLKKN